MVHVPTYLVINFVMREKDERSKRLELPAAVGDKTYFYQLKVCFFM